jgi:hypothetical protein
MGAPDNTSENKTAPVTPAKNAPKPIAGQERITVVCFMVFAFPIKVEIQG